MTLLEYIQRNNTHQTHAEDLVLLGSEGIAEFNDKIIKFMNQMAGGAAELNLTTKVDGAPAVVCWHKFKDYPDDSICLKSFTTTNRNCMSSKEDILSKYGDRPDMAEKLIYCLSIAKSIPAGEAWQGDCLYTKNDLQEVDIDGMRYLTFQPNKIVYAFTEDNASYNIIKNSDFGICFHTIYTGDLEHKSQSFNVDAKRLSNLPANVYVMSPALDTKSVGVDAANLKEEFNTLLVLEDSLLSDPGYDELVNNNLFMSYWNTFENSRLADRKQTNIDINDFYSDFIQYVNDKSDEMLNKKLVSLKTDVAKNRAIQAKNSDLANIESIDKYLLTKLVKVLNKAADIKMSIWNSLKDIKQDYSTFYRSRTQGYLPANIEGIAMSSADGDIVKIVDRSSFSSANRDPDIMSGFEH